jgi:hypothetical protein
MHAEDEFSAGSYGSAKRDAIRVLRGVFPIRIVVEGSDANEVESLVAEINQLVALGELGHLPVGGHKTRGAGWGRWQPATWILDDVNSTRSWAPVAEPITNTTPSASRFDGDAENAWSKWRGNAGEARHVRVTNGSLESPSLLLSEAATLAREALENYSLVAWWCDPTIDLTVLNPPGVFGHEWPNDDNLRIDEVAFFADHAVWRAARTAAGSRWSFIEEVAEDEPGARRAHVMYTPARLHGNARFAAARTDREQVRLREWHVESQMLGFTLVKEQR